MRLSPTKAVILALLLGTVAPPPPVVLVRLIAATIGRAHHPRAELFQCRGRNRIVGTSHHQSVVAALRQSAAGDLALPRGFATRSRAGADADSSSAFQLVTAAPGRTSLSVPLRC